MCIQEYEVDAQRIAGIAISGAVLDAHRLGTWSMQTFYGDGLKRRCEQHMRVHARETESLREWLYSDWFIKACRTLKRDPISVREKLLAIAAGHNSVEIQAMIKQAQEDCPDE